MEGEGSQGGLLVKVALQWRPEGQGVSPVGIWGENIPSRVNDQHKRRQACVCPYVQPTTRGPERLEQEILGDELRGYQGGEGVNFTSVMMDVTNFHHN